ncbi:MAG: hypothetical protein Q7I98_04755 [Erysipelotrichaceae bacterium]|nr:hypothetical protein [Erysipelotrichaceae bacterium]
MRRLFIVLFLILFSIVLSGCVFDVQNADMMRPPKLPTELEAVRTALGIYYGTGMELINPSTGDQTGAIQFEDLDGDDQKEAIAFFKNENDQNALKVAILSHDATLEKWFARSPIVGVGYDIDQVAYPDFDGDGIKEIAIGWLGGSTLNKGLSIYKQSDVVPVSPQGLKGYEEIFREVYTLFKCVDFNQDGTEELLTLHLSRPDNKAEARLYTMRAMGIEQIDTTSLAGDVHRYEWISVGQFDFEKRCVAIDASLSGGATFTEVLVEKEGKLVNVFETEGSSESSLTYRSDFRLTEDVDRDGWLEFPTLIRPVGYERISTGDVPWITAWNHWDSTEKLKSVMRTYDDNVLGFRFKLPDHWGDTVSLTRNAQGAAFVEVRQGEIERKKIIEIAVRPRSEADKAESQMLESGYFELARAIDYVYYGKLYSVETLSDPSLSVSKEIVIKNFLVLN